MRMLAHRRVRSPKHLEHDAGDSIRAKCSEVDALKGSHIRHGGGCWYHRDSAHEEYVDWSVDVRGDTARRMDKLWILNGMGRFSGLGPLATYFAGK